MSRKWERMVKKNVKESNVRRIKSGKTEISGVGDSEADITFRGRNIILPVLLVSISLFFFFTFGEEERGGLYWFTVICYMFLGLIIYFFRKPFLSIGKSHISSRRFGGIKFVEAKSIDNIMLSSGFVVFKFKGKRSGRWVFTKLTNRFDTAAMAVQLRLFAKNNSVNLKEE